MNEFLQYLEKPEAQATYVGLDARWDNRAKVLNERLAAQQLPMRVANMVSIWATKFTQPSRYSWMFQYYLRAQGIAMSWVGSGRFLFSHDFTDADFDEFCERFLAAAVAMRNDGWWWASPQLTHKAIKRQVLREMVRTLLGRKRKANRMQAVPSGPSEPSGAAPESATPELATSGAAHRLGPVRHRVE